MGREEGRRPERLARRRLLGRHRTSRGVTVGGVVERIAFAGLHRLTGPIELATVSGVASTNAAMVDWFARSTPVRVITTKSIQRRPNAGNREPIITEPQPGSFGNAVGLRNPGLEATVEELRLLARRRAGWPRDVLLNISVAAHDPAGFAELVQALAPFADLIELNLSCPHAHGGYGSAIGCDPHAVEACTAAAVAAAIVDGGAVPVFAKLTPNVGDIGVIARRAIEAGAAGITAINTTGPEQYREPESGEVILTNPAPAGARTADEREAQRGRGGRSGRWVRDRALECIAAIRDAVGPAIPVIGMGGVERPEDAARMREAGADVVGVGSALALVHQREWPRFFTALRSRRVVSRSTSVSAPGLRYRASAEMAFRRRIVREVRDLGADLYEIALEGELPFLAGTACFLWVPGVGEKPYSPALASPATFLVRRRGAVSTALCALRRGDAVYVRGPYGEGSGVVAHPYRSRGSGATHATVVAAGSGTALVPSLAASLAAAQITIETWIGMRSAETETPLESTIRRHGALHRVNDDGELGRVLSAVEQSLRSAVTRVRDGDESSMRPERLFFAIGPEPFMRRAVRIALRSGISPTDVHVSLEQRMMCGVGLCGLCHHEGVLTCQHGTFISAERWPGESAESPDDNARRPDTESISHSFVGKEAP
ncbi:MAG: dihydroorotate dehydrogenase [Spirochaetales bacterium]|nr:dihydroorotate dehydrogenase [Spirochaetales bacterium]